jgi:tight adherence protein B
MASSESEGPVAEELRRVVLETQLGQPLVDALDHLRDRVRLESVDLLVDAVRVQQQVGGSLTDLLHSLAEFIRARHELTREVKVLTAEGRMSATVLGALPLFMLLAMGTLNPGYTDPLFQGWGIVWLAMSAGMVALGVAWIRKLSDLEV